MAPFFWTENKTRSLEPSSAAADSMATQAVALFCASVLIFLVCLGSSIVLIRRRRLRHRTQDTTAEVEAQIVQLPAREPAASQPDSKEKGESVSPSRSSSSKSSAAVPLLSLATAPCSGSTATAEKPVEKLMTRTSAALSAKVDKYTTLPLRRARQARQSKLAQKNPVLDFSTPLAALDAEIVDSEANSAAARRSSESHQPSMRSTSLTVGTEMPSRSEQQLLPHSTAMAPSTGAQPEPTLRPSPTVASMEVRPLEADAAALPDAEGMGMLVSGSLPSFSSAFSASSIRQLADDGHAPPEADSLKEKEANKHSFASLDCETPRGRNPCLDAEKGTPSCSESTPSLSTMTTITRRDSSFSSDADTVCELGPGKMSLITVAGKASKLCDPLSFPVAVSDLSLDISSDKGDDIVCSHPNSGADDLGGLTKYSEGLTTLV